MTLDRYEHGVVINALNEMRNDLIEEERPTDIVDEVLLKAIDAPTKKQGSKTMKHGSNPRILYLLGIIPAVWLGLLIAPAISGGLPEILARFPAVINDPFHIELCKDSLKAVLILWLSMEWESELIYRRAAITARVKNTARQNGAMHEPSTKNIGQQRRKKIRYSRRMFALI